MKLEICSIWRRKLNLQNANYLSEDDYKFMKPCGSKSSVMYRHCKVHKGMTPNDVPPFRPTLSSLATCSYNLVKCLVPLLKQYTISECTVKDSFYFCKEIVNQDPELFINIPIDETTDICVAMVYNKRKCVKGMLKCHFKQLLTLSFKCSFFLFNGVYQKQIDGVGKGSPLGPALANIM